MGGSNLNLNTRELMLIRFASTLAPIFLFVYGLSIEVGLARSPHYHGIGPLAAICAVWLVAAIWHWIFQSRRWVQITFAIILHALVVLYIIFVSGIYTPILGLYVLLFICSYFYAARLGFYLSALCVISAALSDFVYIEDPMIRLNAIVSVVTLVFVAQLLLIITRSQQVDQQQFSETKVARDLERDRLITLINNLTDAVISTDIRGVVRIYNAASLNLLDTNTNLNGRSIDEVLTVQGADHKPVSIAKLLTTATRVTVRDDLIIPFEDDPMRIEMTFSPIRSSFSETIRDPGSDGYILILRDITKAKSLEEERDEFISVVSHELRTPLSITEGTISNLGFMLARGQMSPEAQQQSITSAHEQILFLSKMVNDLSTLSRAERGVGDASEIIDIKSLMQDLTREYAEEAGSAGLALNLDLGQQLGKVDTSPLYLRELLQNFLTNAIKYTREGSVTLRATRDSDRVTFAVSDTGIGISKSDQAKIFQKFYRSEDYRTRETRGTGLGLYVALKLASKIGTRIELSSRLNHGSTFSFTLDALPHEQRPSADPEATLNIPNRK